MITEVQVTHLGIVGYFVEQEQTRAEAQIHLYFARGLFCVQAAMLARWRTMGMAIVHARFAPSTTVSGPFSQQLSMPNTAFCGSTSLTLSYAKPSVDEERALTRAWWTPRQRMTNQQPIHSRGFPTRSTSTEDGIVATTRLPLGGGSNA